MQHPFSSTRFELKVAGSKLMLSSNAAEYEPGFQLDKIRVKVAGSNSNAAEMKFAFPHVVKNILSCAFSTKFKLKFAGSNAAEIELHLSLD